MDSDDEWEALHLEVVVPATAVVPLDSALAWLPVELPATARMTWAELVRTGMVSVLDGPELTDGLAPY